MCSRFNVEAKDQRRERQEALVSLVVALREASGPRRDIRSGGSDRRRDDSPWPGRGQGSRGQGGHHNPGWIDDRVVRVKN